MFYQNVNRTRLIIMVANWAYHYFMDYDNDTHSLGYKHTKNLLSEKRYSLSTDIPTFSCS